MSAWHEKKEKGKMVVKGISRKIFRRIALESCQTVYLRDEPMTVSENYPTIHLGGLSNRFYRNSIVCFENNNLFFLKECFLTLGLDMREGVNEGSRSGKG